MLKSKKILEALKKVEDPELKMNIVDLGLIYDTKIEREGKVTVKMTLTTPGCPLSFVFEDLITEALKNLKEVKEVKIDLTFDPPWNPNKMSKEARLQLGFME